ncbi:Galectin-8, partial [Buceros rhinoceros silvestris]
NRFQVDLQCGSSVTPRADVAFHFNPRFKKYGCIVCNTLTRQRWGWEEITKEMPFQKGKPFEIVITVLSDKYQVSVNKRHLLLYNHRISLEKVDTLGIYGKVMIKTIKFGYNGRFFPTIVKLSLYVEKSKSQSKFLLVVYLQGVSYIKTLDTGLSPGCMVTVKGGVDKYAKNFVINLRPSDSNDIALHLNAQVEYQVFVRNSYVNDSWGEEKEIANFPFTPGMYLELIIFCEAHQFKVAVNGVHTLEYKHRFKQLEKINTVEISGDIKLLDV